MYKAFCNNAHMSCLTLSVCKVQAILQMLTTVTSAYIDLLTFTVTVQHSKNQAVRYGHTVLL